MDEFVRWLGEQLNKDERIARAASGGTVVGEPGNWEPSPAGDEWEAFAGDIEEELLVALRPNLPRPPVVLSGMWGAIVSQEPDPAEGDAASAMPALVHAAKWDPARVLREIDAKRQILRDLKNAEVTLAAAGSEGTVHDLMTGAANTLRRTVRLLAAPYADRPGYREEWRP
ncbi:DUF6221 family protein [Streptomyces sp. NPDC017941]|uniref:DUF6221 family protein n=1 Tax=Streptomyces sp. NPDC017941 TaxID=3365018 RepID=UPI0037B6AAA0